MSKTSNIEKKHVLIRYKHPALYCTALKQQCSTPHCTTQNYIAHTSLMPCPALLLSHDHVQEGQLVAIDLNSFSVDTLGQVVEIVLYTKTITVVQSWSFIQCF